MKVERPAPLVERVKRRGPAHELPLLYAGTYAETIDARGRRCLVGSNDKLVCYVVRGRREWRRYALLVFIIVDPKPYFESQ